MWRHARHFPASRPKHCSLSCCRHRQTVQNVGRSVKWGGPSDPVKVVNSLHYVIKIYTYGGRGGIAPLFLLHSLDGGDSSNSRSSRLICMGNIPGTHWTEGYENPRATMHAVWCRIIWPLPIIEPGPSSPYTAIIIVLCKIWDFHGGDYEEWFLLGCYAVWLL
jgi:hypothetical protein